MDDLQLLKEQLARILADLQSVREKLDRLENAAGAPPAEDALPATQPPAQATEGAAPVLTAPVLLPQSVDNSLVSGQPAAETSSVPDQPAGSSVADTHAAFVGFEREIARRGPRDDLETRVASYWFLRIGIVAMAIGFIFFARKYSIGPWAKIAAGYGASLALIALGIWKERLYRLWAHPLIAGGLALSYFTTYSAGFLAPMKVVDSLPWELMLLSLNVVAVMAFAEWRKSEVIAGVSLVLGYISTAVSRTPAYAHYSLIFLAVAAVVFMSRNRFFYASVAAVLATYVAHLYAWKYLPGASSSDPASVFHEHAQFLASYFIAFALGGVVSARVAVANPVISYRDETPPFFRPSVTRPELLTAFVQLNTVLYMAGMIYVLRETRVYWGDAWVFFFAFAAVVFGLGFFCSQLPVARFFYRLVGAVSFSFGLVSYFSLRWIPVLFAIEASAILLYAIRTRSKAWAIVSLLPVVYGGLQIVHVSVRFSLTTTHALVSVAPPDTIAWWSVASACFLFLVHSVIWSRFVRSFVGSGRVDYLVAGFSALVYLHAVEVLMAPGEAQWAAALLPPVVVACLAVALRAPGLQVFAIVATAILFLVMFSPPGRNPVPEWLLWFTAVGAVVACIAAERRGSGEQGLDAVSSVALFLGAQGCVLILQNSYLTDEQIIAGTAAQSAVAIGIAVAAASSRLMATSALVAFLSPVMFLLQVEEIGSVPAVRHMSYMAASILACAALIFGTQLQRTGGRRAGTELLLMLAAGGMLSSIAAVLSPRLWFFSAGLCGFAMVLLSVLLSRVLLSMAGLLFLTLTGIGCLLSCAVGGGRNPALIAWYGTAGALLLVISERLLHNFRRLALVPEESPGDFPFKENILPACNVVVLVAIMMFLCAVRLHPSIQNMLFTAAVVLAGVLWIAMGFVFPSKVYRRVGFVAVCFAIVKAFGWDVRSLPETYKYISFFALGLMLIGASFMYTKWRDKIRELL